MSNVKMVDLWEMPEEEHTVFKREVFRSLNNLCLCSKPMYVPGYSGEKCCRCNKKIEADR